MSLSEEDLKQLQRWVDQAIIRMEEVVESFPDEKMLRSVRQQLDFLFRISRHDPTDSERRRFALGLTARRLESVDEELAKLFARISNYLDA
jgi:hypothetical protein